MKSNAKVLVKARIQVVLEVTLDQPWDENATGAQVYQQAKRSGREAVEFMTKTHHNVRVLGEPTVTMILAEEKTT